MSFNPGNNEILLSVLGYRIDMNSRINFHFLKQQEHMDHFLGIFSLLPASVIRYSIVTYDHTAMGFMPMRKRAMSISF